MIGECLYVLLEYIYWPLKILDLLNRCWLFAYKDYWNDFLPPLLQHNVASTDKYVDRIKRFLQSPTKCSIIKYKLYTCRHWQEKHYWLWWKDGNHQSFLPQIYGIFSVCILLSFCSSCNLSGTTGMVISSLKCFSPIVMKHLNKEMLPLLAD